MQTKKWIPWTMVVGRAMLGPLLMMGERCRWNGMALAVMVLAAFVSDIFDGVLARRWNTDTSVLRLSDSLADTFFYLCVAVAVGFGMPGVWGACRSGVLLVIGCEAVRFGYDFIKFGKPASYHSYLAKTWGLVLAAAVIVTFTKQNVSMWMLAAVVLGVLSNAETMAMSFLLPVWRRDVKTLWEAWRLRTELLHGCRAKRPVRVFAGLTVVFGLAILGAPLASAQALEHVTYVGGTALQGTGIHGKVSVGSADALVFEGPSKLSIPYDHVISYESRNHKQVHVGLLTEGLWRMVAPWPEAKQLSVSYRDTDDHTQVVVLQMSRGDEAMLVEVLKTRVPLGGTRALSPRNPVVAQEKPAGH